MAMEKVYLHLKWTHQFQFAGHYVAKELGFYSEEGLDVEIIERKVGESHIDKVEGRIGHYGISDSSVVVEYLKGRGFIVVSTIFQHSPLVLATLKKNNILGPLELKGKKVMFQKGIDDAILAAMFNAFSLSTDELIQVPHTFKLDDLISGRVDAVSAYTTNQPYELKKRGIEYHLIYPENYGVDLYGDMIFTSKEEVVSNPDRVRRFRRASIRGWKYAFEHFEEALQIVKKYSKHSLDQLRFEGIETKKMILPYVIDIGVTSTNRLYRIAKIYNPSEHDISQKVIEDVLFDKFVENRSWTKIILRWGTPIAGIIILVIVVQAIYTRRLSKMVLARTKELQKANEVKDLFFHNITHELRTPLNGIVCGADSLRRENLSQENQDLVDMISYSGKTLLHIVNDILDYSKIQRKKFDLKKRAFDFNEVLQNMDHFFGPLAQNKGISFSIDNSLKSSVMVLGDDIRLTQILNNLISNAIKFTDKGEVRLLVKGSTMNDYTYFNLDVIDTGVGIAKDQIERLFRPFVQLDQRSEISLLGTGLGLAIAKELVELMDGKIEIDTSVSEGTIIHLYFRLKSLEKINNNGRAASVEEELSFHSMKALVVDDNDINRKVLGLLLKKYNFDIEYASDGIEALSKIESENNYQIVFLDVNMPGMDGIEVTKKIRSNKNYLISGLYIVGYSANTLNEKDSSHLFGMNAYLEKPVRKSDLYSCLLRYKNERQ